MEKLASFYTKLKFNDLNEEVINSAKRCTLDLLGVAIGGSNLPSSKKVVNIVKSMGGKLESSVIANDLKVPSPNAALANGVMAHGLELDDVDNESSTHPGAVIIPTALAVAEKVEASGKEFILAITSGYDLMLRIGAALIPSAHYARGFHPTATCGAFGAALTASILMGLDTNEVMNALGIAGSQASGLMEFLSDGSWTKRLHPGWAAHSGIIASLLAKEGFTGPKTILEGKHGFIKAHTDHYDMNKLIEGLGERFLINEVSIKPHACCRYIQPAIDAVLKIVKENEINPKDIDEVIIGTVKTALPIVVEPIELKYKPRNIVDAQFSMPFSISVAILKGRAFINEYTEEMIKNDEVLNIAKKVKVINDPELDKLFPKKWQAKAKIKLKNGKIYESHVEAPKGDPENPLTDKELEDKFRILVQGKLLEDKINEAIKMIHKLDKLSNIKEFVHLFTIEEGKNRYIYVL
ncbi:MAG: MmgE/PrpD family protein [Nitrososphaerales archaeon]